MLGLALASVVVLFVGLGLIGAATAGALQSRFAATDLASARSRGRDLALVVWSTTVGAVTGPNLAEPGNAVGTALGLPSLAGVFLFPLVAQLLAAGAYLGCASRSVLVSRGSFPRNLAVGRPPSSALMAAA